MEEKAVGPGWYSLARHAVTWPNGNLDIPRVVLRADDTSFKAAAYSFDSKTYSLDMRLIRIQSGRYQIGLYTDPNKDGNADEPIWTTAQNLSRFDTVDLPVPPGKWLSRLSSCSRMTVPTSSQIWPLTRGM